MKKVLIGLPNSLGDGSVLPKSEAGNDCCNQNDELLARFCKGNRAEPKEKYTTDDPEQIHNDDGYNLTLLQWFAVCDKKQIACESYKSDAKQ